MVWKNWSVFLVFFQYSWCSPPGPAPNPFFFFALFVSHPQRCFKWTVPIFGDCLATAPPPPPPPTHPIPQAIKMPAWFVLRLQESELACLNGFSVSLASVSIFPRYFLVVSFFPPSFLPNSLWYRFELPCSSFVLLVFVFFFCPAFSAVFSCLSAHTTPLNPAVLVMGVRDAVEFKVSLMKSGAVTNSRTLRSKCFQWTPRLE